MGLPEEDLPPSWLRDYGDIEADISKMEEFAAKLHAEVVDNYAPHLPYIYDAMAVELPQPSALFPELVSFLTTHQASQQATSDLVYFYRDATGGFATAAAEVSKNYGAADAFSAANVHDVEKALDQTAAARPTAPGATAQTPHPSIPDATEAQ